MAKLEKKANVRVRQLCGGVCSMSKALNGCLELMQALCYVESSDQDGVPGAYRPLAIFLIHQSRPNTHCLGVVV